jgi:hypothetical protein
MAISPFSARPASHGSERRRARIALAMAAVGIAAILLAYAISPGVRHAVSHAAHSVKHAVGNVFDHDSGRDDRRAGHQRPHAHVAKPLTPARSK